jgi:hypothetical protein
MKKAVLISIVIMLAFTFIKADSVDVNHFLICPSINGESGFIYNPSGYILENNMLSLGLHSYLFKANYGFYNLIEAGLKLNIGTSSEILDILKTSSINLKAKLLDEEKYFVSLAAGIEEIPIAFYNLFDDNPFRPYVAVSKKIYDMNFTAGYMAKRGKGIFADASKVIDDTVLAIAEYDGEHYNAGVKISLNYNFNIEIFIKEIDQMNNIRELGEFLRDYFIFGITYIQ